MASAFRPTDDAQVREAVAWALGADVPLELAGRGTRRGLGRPVQADSTLDLSALAGIIAYEPEELFLSARPGTPVAEIEAALAERGQMLAFEPMDTGALFGAAPGAGSIGGVFACNLSGPRRIKAGAARDHLLGFDAVSGRAEAFKSGGRVVKNVTGYDLSKLVCGSHGTLAALTQVTFKTLPAPEKTRTVLVLGLDAPAAARAMSAATRSAHAVAGAAHLPARIAARCGVSRVSGAGASVTALRLEGFGPSVERRLVELRAEMAGFGPVEELHTRNSARFWAEARDAAWLAEPAGRPVWRVSVAPMDGWRIVAELAAAGDVETFQDWAGGLVWASFPPGGDGGAAAARAAVARTGGHATLFRAPADLRAAVPVFQPQPRPLAALAARVKESFDPRRILNPGRMTAGL